MKSPFLDPTAAAAAPVPRGGALGRVRVACGAARVSRRIVGAGLARPGPGRPSLLVAALPEPLDHLLPAQEGAAAPAPEQADEVQSGVASAQISSPPAVHETTVRVRFVLREQCTFGHSFHLVGDDPALGLWDPASAAALEWSEGHDWTVQKDLPANRSVEFKFLLRDSSGEFQWQNGPNRNLQTGETAKTLVVYEDWGDEKNQEVTEQGDVPVEMAEVIATDDDDKSINDVVAANELQLVGSQEIKEDESGVGDDESSAVAATASAGGESANACEADQSELVMDEQNIQDDLPDEVDTAPQNDSATTYADDDYGERTNDDSILSKDGVLVKNEWTRAFERELLWGWKSLQQLLGFKMDTT